MSGIQITILGDGSSDANLKPIVEWVLLGKCPKIAYQIEFARHMRTGGLELHRRVIAANSLYPCNLLVVHRDAERESVEARKTEVAEAIALTGLTLPVVAVVPVRMTEAWLLFDEIAIRSAAGNPNGKMALGLPKMKDVEKLPSPKEIMFEALKSASGLTGRRLASFNVQQARNRVADLIDDFSALRQLKAFSDFELDFQTAVEALA